MECFDFGKKRQVMWDTALSEKMENVTLEIKGRHDPAIVRRASVVVDSVLAITVSDMLASRYGTDVFLNGIN